MCLLAICMSSSENISLDLKCPIPFLLLLFFKIFTFLQSTSLKLFPSGRLGSIMKPAVFITTSSQSLAWVFFISYLGYFLPSFKDKCVCGGGSMCVCVCECVYVCVYMCLLYYQCHTLSCCLVKSLFSPREGRGELGRLS